MPTAADRGAPSAAAPRRAMLFALHSVRREMDEATRYQLTALRSVADHTVVIADAAFPPAERDRVRELCDRLVLQDGPAVDARAYRVGLGALADRIAEFDEVILTGNSWFGPIGSFDGVLDRMAEGDGDLWQLIDTRRRTRESYAPEAFPLEGFPAAPQPWVWSVARRGLIASDAWKRYWAADHRHDEEEFAGFFLRHGATVAAGFSGIGSPQGEIGLVGPGLLAPRLLLEAGCPLLLRALFAQFPPFLDRYGVLIRPLVAEMARQGYPIDALWRAVARSTPPSALNTLAGMLEILPDGPVRERAAGDAAAPRVCVLVHMPGLGFVDELAERLRQIPGDFDLVVTTTDGARAARLRARLTASSHAWAKRAEVRITAVPGGRDIGALLVGCRDILLSDRYDLVVRLHGRESGRKAANVREYSRRYQLENLLSSPGYVQRIYELFRREPGLGLVFPPMIHVGYAVMGRGWGPYRPAVERLCEEMGVRVPLDEVSPLAPYGGMWIGRPQALRRLVEHGWNSNDYGRSRYVELTRVQERLLCLAAAEDGYHCRTVLNREHAQVAFTALEFKSDELFSTTRGYPVEQIHLLRRAGWTGYGGRVSVGRMYLNLNHPRMAHLLRPVFGALHRTARRGRRVVSLLRRRGEAG